MRPKVSAVMPVYNGLPYLARAVESLRRQRGVELEIVCVDDGSTDGSREWLARAAAADPRVRVVLCPHNGIVAALNAGLAAARYPLIARMDADDVAHPDRLRLQAALLEGDRSLGVVGTQVRSFPDRAVSPAFRNYEAWNNCLTDPDRIGREIFIESPIVHPSAMYRRDEALELGGYRALPWAEDYDLWLRYHQAGYRLGKVPRVLLGWRMRPNRLSFADPRCARRAFIHCKAHFLARDARVRAGPVVVWGAGMTGRRLGKALLREGVEIAAFCDISPGKIGRTVFERPVLPVESVKDADAFVIAAVGAPGARQDIRARMAAWGRREGADYLFVA
ncbi:MAG: glycosyltransferase [Firmicutes bacterium]|nr:glycosyltransferase [Bacillota bacterium]